MTQIQRQEEAGLDLVQTPPYSWAAEGACGSFHMKEAIWLERGARAQISVHHPGSDLPGKNKSVIHILLLSSRKVQEGERRAVLSSPEVLKGTTLIVIAFAPHTLPSLCREVPWDHGGSSRR